MEKKILKLVSFERNLFLESSSKSNRIAVVLHGRGCRKERSLSFATTLNRPDWNYLLLDAPDPWPKDSGKGHSWYDKKPNEKAGIERSSLMLSVLIQELNSLGFLNRNIMFIGFSQGCVMALETLFQVDESLFGIIGISGYVHDVSNKTATDAALNTPVLLTHGWRDKVLDINETLEDWELLKKILPQTKLLKLNKSHNISLPEYEIFRDSIKTWENTKHGA
jgi:predicted esterase